MLDAAQNLYKLLLIYMSLTVILADTKTYKFKDHCSYDNHKLDDEDTYYVTYNGETLDRSKCSIGFYGGGDDVFDEFKVCVTPVSFTIGSCNIKVIYSEDVWVDDQTCRNSLITSMPYSLIHTNCSENLAIRINKTNVCSIPYEDVLELMVRHNPGGDDWTWDNFMFFVGDLMSASPTWCVEFYTKTYTCNDYPAEYCVDDGEFMHIDISNANKYTNANFNLKVYAIKTYDHGKTVGIIVGSIVGGIVFCSVCVVVFIVIMCRRRHQNSAGRVISNNPTTQPQPQPQTQTFPAGTYPVQQYTPVQGQQQVAYTTTPQYGVPPAQYGAPIPPAKPVQ